MIHDQTLLNYIMTSQVMVNVEPLYSVPNATTIHLEPLSTQDWELIEVFADKLEAGLLLSQISIVYPNQIVPLFVGSDIAYLRVLETSSFTSKDEEDDNKRLVDHKCLRLIAESEVIISPKPRKSKNKEIINSAKSYTPSTPLRVQPTEEDYSVDMKRLFDHFNNHDNHASSSMTMIPCPPLFHVWVNPITLSQRLNGWNEFGSTEKKSAFALVKKCKSYSTGSNAKNKSSDDIGKAPH